MKIKLNPEYMKLPIGDLLYAQIKDKSFTVEQVLDRSHINRGIFYTILKSKRRITAYTASLLEPVLGLTAIEWLAYQAWNDFVEEQYISSNVYMSRAAAKEAFYKNRFNELKKATNRYEHKTMGSDFLTRRNT